MNLLEHSTLLAKRQQDGSLAPRLCLATHCNPDSASIAAGCPNSRTQQFAVERFGRIESKSNRSGRQLRRRFLLGVAHCAFVMIDLDAAWKSSFFISYAGGDPAATFWHLAKASPGSQRYFIDSSPHDNLALHRAG
jgi:hypothetical protein